MLGTQIRVGTALEGNGNFFLPIMVTSQELRSTSLHLSPFASLWLDITLLGDLAKASAILFDTQHLKS